MSTLAIAEKVAAGLREPLAELGVDVEWVEVQKAGRRHVVRVVVDRDGGVDLDLVAAVSQRVSEVLDGPALAAELPGPFVLEVSSPGVDRPLTEARHWRRAAGRLVEATLTDGTVVVGRVGEMPDDATVLVTAPNGDEQRIALADVTLALVQVEFTRSDEE
jgi:ribosome maturation factor RimP